MITYTATFTEDEAHAVGFALKTMIRTKKEEMHRETNKGDFDYLGDLVGRLESAYFKLDTAKEINTEPAPVSGQRPPPNAWITPEEEQLLKAAPALLEALQAILNDAEDFINDEDGPPAVETFQAIREMARAAIAQAEGRVAE